VALENVADLLEELLIIEGQASEILLTVIANNENTKRRFRSRLPLNYSLDIARPYD
jgi:hypothetical protein